jgi:hypothetical protein
MNNGKELSKATTTTVATGDDNDDCDGATGDGVTGFDNDNDGDG